ncbi:hypothetical protein [Ketogulonicigenium vulgare]|uniref:hypothetical protein n=1 Tax=Ketogulonicigenium vulgare TaxID=92945 RepID=UPI002359AD9B|nr:hypothetical protein [Ketogulonicigenium vulgare]
MLNTDNRASQDEKRALSADEQTLADRTRQPELGRLTNKELSETISLLRERRNRARDVGDRQSREARGKAEPAGVSAAVGNLGMRSKSDFLNEALERATNERTQRGEASDL